VNRNPIKPSQAILDSVNLVGANRAMSALLPQLPETRLGESLGVSGLRLPNSEVLARTRAAL
jgi:hypothetical protein